MITKKKIKKIFFVCNAILVLLSVQIKANSSSQPLKKITIELPQWSGWHKDKEGLKQKALRRFYVNAITGNDQNEGNSPDKAWKTIKRVNQHSFQAGDHILFQAGQTFSGMLKLHQVEGTNKAMIYLSSYGQGKAIIDGKQYVAAIHLEDSKFININNLEIVNDNSLAQPLTPQEADNIWLSAKMRKKLRKHKHAKKIENRGIYITATDGGTTKDIYIENVYVHDIFPAKESFSEGKMNYTHYGYGIEMRIEKNVSGTIEHILINNSKIERTGHFGIRTKRIRNDGSIKDIVVSNCHTLNTGGSGLILGWVENVLVVHNVIDKSGSFIDRRMHGRGSGSWTFAAKNVLYENNKFMNSKGKGDSAGAHVDFGCTNVIVQRNLSVNNEGGFMEVLGDNYNCAYRYNISINDGARIKGVKGANQEGKTLFVSGHCMKAPFGPFNSYFYNNTVFVKEGINPKFAITHSAKGLMIVNNIFHLMTDATKVYGDQPTAKKFRKHPNKAPKKVVFENNIYTRSSTLPSDLMVDDSHKIVANPEFANPGGVNPKDYIPNNIKDIKNKGMVIQHLPGDIKGIEGGVQVKYDFFGKPIVGKPDMGAIELQ